MFSSDDDTLNRTIVYYFIYLFFLWVLSFQYPYKDYEIIGNILLFGGCFFCNFLSSYQYKIEYRKMMIFKENIKSELYGEIYNDILEELKEELKDKK